MKFNVYQHERGSVYPTEPNSLDDTCMRESTRYIFIGTLDLPIEPVKREVEKENVRLSFSTCFDNRNLQNIYGTVPKDAYDITVHYKVKE